MTTPLTGQQRNNIVKALDNAKQEILDSVALPLARLELGTEMGRDVIAWALPDDGKPFDTGAAEQILNKHLAGIITLSGATVTGDRKDPKNYLRFWFFECVSDHHMVDENQSPQKATGPVTFTCPGCKEPVEASRLAKAAMFKGVKDEDINCPWCSRRIELPTAEHERLVALALKEFNDFDPNTVDKNKLFDELALVETLERVGGLRVIRHAGRIAIRLTDRNAAEALLGEAGVATADSGRKLLQKGEIRGVDAQDVFAKLTEYGKKGKATQATQKQPSGCFVATAVYGDYQCAEVRRFRQYRDDVLSRSLIGRAVIRLYYNVGPHLAELIAPYPIRKKACRYILDRALSRITRADNARRGH